MFCQKCKHEFCWFCLSPYYQYRHSYNLYCPFRTFSVNFSIAVILFMLNFKLAYNSYYLSLIEYHISFNLFCIVFLGIFLISFFGYIVMGGVSYEYLFKYKTYQNDRVHIRILKSIMITLLAITLGGAQYLFYYLVHETKVG